jgi:hypothetical protein
MDCTTVRDDSYGDERWIEVKPPNQDLLAFPGRARNWPRADVPRRQSATSQGPERTPPKHRPQRGSACDTLLVPSEAVVAVWLDGHDRRFLCARTHAADGDGR